MKSIHITKRGLLLALGGAVALLLVACGGGSSDKSQPTEKSALAAKIKPSTTIAWRPESLTFSISPGTSKTVPITFTSTKELEKILVTVSPSLQGLVQATPGTIRELDKGKRATVTLNIAPTASSTLGVLEGSIQISAGKNTSLASFPITIVVATGAVGALPPDPGEAGKATLAGIDSDGDGVRDDIQRYIWLTYPQSEKIRASLRQSTLAMQTLILGNGTAVSNMLLVNDETACASVTFMTGPADVRGGQRALKSSEKLASVIFNTSARIRAYGAANSQFDGTVFSMIPFNQRASHCTTPLTSFSN